MRNTLARLTLTGLALTTFVAVGCSTEPDALDAPVADEIVEHDANTGTVDFFAPNDNQRVLAPGGDAAEAALAWMDANKGKLGIPDPRASFTPIGTTLDDEDGSVAVKLQQRVNGIPIWGVESVVHFDGDGTLIAFDGPYIPNLDALANAMPKVNDATALSTVEAWARNKVAGAAGVSIVANELVVYVDDFYANAALARHVRVEVDSLGMTTPIEAFVDAQTGAIIIAWIDAMSAPQTATGLDGVQHTVEVNPAEGQWELFRPGANKRGDILPLVWDAAGPNDLALAQGARIRANEMAGPWDAHAVSAYAHVLTTDRFFREKLKFAGPDGKGGPVRVFVHFATNPPRNTAFAAGVGPGYPQRPHIFFSDGGSGFKSPAVALDIVAHEYTHLVNGFAHGLGALNEPGSINEGIADIFGAFVEFDARGNEEKALMMSEDVGGVAHYFLHPTRNPDRRDHYSKKRTVPAGESPLDHDNGHSHNNSTIISNAWALMTVGGTNDTSGYGVSTPLGWDKSRSLWWKTQRRAITKRSTILRLARAQTVTIAQRSKGKFDKRTVACGWYAVGALSDTFLKKKLRISCDRGAADSCAGKANGIYCSASDSEAGYFCKGGELTKVRCEKGFTCKGASADSQVLACQKN